jgi:uncharacterized protein
MIERIRFSADGDWLVGNLHRPADPGRFPAVVVAGPMTSVKEQVTGVYAAALAKRGIAALAIDHRGYGESGGEPRQYEHSGRKIADIGAALDALIAFEGIDADRLGLAGVCLGCGYASWAAIERKEMVKGLALAVGYYRNPSAMRASDPDGFAARMEQGRQARLHYEATGEVLNIPAVALHGDAAMQSADLFDYYGTPRAGVANYVNGFAVMSREHFLPFDVQAAASQITQPVAMVHGRNALSPHWAEQFHMQLANAEPICWIDGPNQVAFYDDTSLVDAACDHMAAHLHAAL